METKKLNAKDLINVGIYTALYLVVFFIVGALNAIPILYPISLFYLPIATGIPFMLFITKVKKPGMVFIMSLILGIFWFLMGYTWLPVASYIIFGLLAELVFKAADYTKFKLITVGYGFFCCGSLGCQAPMWLMADSYMKSIKDNMGEQYATQLAKYMPSWMGIAGLGLAFIGAIIGAFLGRKMLKKHFKRAGIV